jgi:hypothetical protein
MWDPQHLTAPVGLHAVTGIALLFYMYMMLAYVNLLADNIDIINKNTQILIDAGKKVGLEVNVEKTKYMLVSRDQNAGQNWEIKIGNRSFENVSLTN